MSYFDYAPIDLTPQMAEPEHAETLPGIDMLIELAAARARHIGQGVLDLKDMLA